MKWMKWLLVLTVGVGVAFAAVGCDDDDDSSSSKSSLVGTWKATHFNGQEISSDIASVTITFRSDHTFNLTMTFGLESETESGTWSTAGGILTTTTPEGSESIAYTLSGNTLTITDPDEGVITLRRQ